MRYLFLLLSLITSLQVVSAPSFPDFELSLRRYRQSDALYADFFENISQERFTKVVKNRQFKKFLQTLYNTSKISQKEVKCHIPKIIHQIWLGSPVPEKYQKWMQSWQGWDGWEYKLWTDQDVDSFGLYNQKLYDQATNYGERSDILRYEILLREGGLYVDIDFECIDPSFFDFAHQHYDLYAGIEPLETSSLSINNALLASAPGHPLIKAMVLDLAVHYEKYYDPDIGIHNTIHTTGPRYLTKQFKRKELHKGKIDIAFPPTFFYPLIWDELRLPPSEFSRFLKSESCAIHWWSGSWYKGVGAIK